MYKIVKFSLNSLFAHTVYFIGKFGSRLYSTFYYVFWSVHRYIRNESPSSFNKFICFFRCYVGATGFVDSFVYSVRYKRVERFVAGSASVAVRTADPLRTSPQSVNERAAVHWVYQTKQFFCTVPLLRALYKKRRIVWYKTDIWTDINISFTTGQNRYVS